MGDKANEERFIASMCALDGAPKFIHSSFRVPDNSALSELTGQKLTAESLLSASTRKEWTKSLKATVSSKVKDSDRLSGPAARSLEAKKLKRTGAFESNREQISETWDSTIKKRRAAKHFDFTNHTSDKPLEKIEDACKKFTIQTPLEAEISKILYGESANKEEKQFFLQDHSKDLKATRKHLAEIARAKMLASKKEAKEKYRNKIKSKRYRRVLRRNRRKDNEQNGATKELEVQAEYDRVKERASLKHKTVTKKLRFYDKNNGKESTVRQTQSEENNKLKARVSKFSGQNSSSDSEDDSEPNSVHSSCRINPRSSGQGITKTIDPNDFILPNSYESESNSADSDGDEDDTFSADMATFDSGIELEPKGKKAKQPKTMPGWGSWSSSKSLEQKEPEVAAKKKRKYVNALVMKDAKVKLADHQLPQVPHPYRNLDDAQAELAMPVGDTFNPKTTVLKNIKPKVHVKLGASLEPEMKDEI